MTESEFTVSTGQTSADGPEPCKRCIRADRLITALRVRINGLLRPANLDNLKKWWEWTKRDEDHESRRTTKAHFRDALYEIERLAAENVQLQAVVDIAREVSAWHKALDNPKKTHPRQTIGWATLFGRLDTSLSALDEKDPL